MTLEESILPQQQQQQPQMVEDDHQEQYVFIHSFIISSHYQR
jgi:hypothetical protein